MHARTHTVILDQAVCVEVRPIAVVSRHGDLRGSIQGRADADDVYERVC